MEVGQHPIRAARQRTEEPAVRPAVDTQPVGRLVHRPCQDGGRAVVQRVGHRQARMDQLQPVLREVELAEEARSGGQRVEGGADVVPEAGQSQLGGAAAAPDAGGGLQHPHRTPRPGQGDGGGQAIGPAADDDGV